MQVRGAVGSLTPMKCAFLLLAIWFGCGVVHAAELQISAAEPIVITAPDQWTSAKEKAQTKFETYRIQPPAGRNALCLVSIFGKDKETFTDPAFLKKLLKGDSRPYVGSPDDLAKIDVKELKVSGGLGFYADFVDPDLAGKPVQKGNYKVATPIIVAVGSKYLLKFTVLSDEVGGSDHREMLKMIQNIRLKNDVK
jgi:hypothetical protein